MRKALYIVCLFALTACSSTQLPPIDDVYYWDKHELTVAKTLTTFSDPNAPKDPKDPKDSTAPKASIEYLNVQDTTITVRIKK